MSDGWALLCIVGGALLAVVLLTLLIVVGIGKPLSEAGCNQRGDEYGLSADYRLLSNICFLELPDGRWIDANSIRAQEPTGR